MARILYPILTEPVLPPSLTREAVTEDRWHRPFSEPVRVNALPTAVVASTGIFWSGFTPATITTPSMSSWHRPLSEPTRAVNLASVYAGNAWGLFTPAPSMSSWHRALSEPTREANRGSAVYAGNDVWSLFTPAPPMPSWYRSLSEPTREPSRNAALASGNTQVPMISRFSDSIAESMGFGDLVSATGGINSGSAPDVFMAHVNRTMGFRGQ